MQKLRIATFLTIVLATVGAGVAMAGGGGDDRRGKHKGKRAVATLVNGQGAKVGVVTLHQWRGKITVAGRVKGMTPGFHGFHVHTTGRCDGPDFTSAGGHFKTDAAQNHSGHAGDLPSLLVNGDGTASAAFETDRFTLQQLRDADGSALMVHAGPDNFANIPPRYAPAPDAETLNTGDSGGRVACGVVR
jgi:superoxide dismutase, Cu-Zn family